MPFVVVYDASVLYPSTLRDLLIRLAQTGMIQARWTEQIMDEMFEALRRGRPDLDPAKLDRTRTLMGVAVRDWKITEYEALVDSLKLPDPDDRHVLAARDPGSGTSDRDGERSRLPGRGTPTVGHRGESAGRFRTRSDQPQPFCCVRRGPTDRGFVAESAGRHRRRPQSPRTQRPTVSVAELRAER